MAHHETIRLIYGSIMLPEVSRDQVLTAVRRSCADGHQPSMTELAASARVSTRTLYRLFGSRAALLQEAGCTPPATTRTRILDAALDYFGRYGLADLSMDDLATTAGVSRATLYRLFPGKAALFGELVQTFSPWEPVADVLDAMGDASPDETVPAVAQAIAGTFQDRIGVLLRIVLELREGEPDTTEAMRRTMARGLPDLVRYLEGQMQAGRLRTMHPVLALQLLAGPIMAHHLTKPLADQPTLSAPVSDAEFLDQTVRAWLRAMAPEPGQ